MEDLSASFIEHTLFPYDDQHGTCPKGFILIQGWPKTDDTVEKSSELYHKCLTAIRLHN